MGYNWQLANWPGFVYEVEHLLDSILRFEREVGVVYGLLEGSPVEISLQSTLELMVAEAVKTSAIEGEYFSRQDVMSSIKNHLGYTGPKLPVSDRRAGGIGELMVAVRQHYATPLTAEELFAWHTLIFPGSPGIGVGKWRTHAEPMQVVSGAYGKEKVHFEAPPSGRVPDEMRQFIRWFNDSAPGGRQPIRHAPVRAALAHLYFESIHPFEDGNGRIGRAVAEKALSQSIGRPVVLSLSSVLEANKNEYYAQLQKAQGTLTVDQWLSYFVGVALEAQVLAGQVVRFTLKKARFLDKAKPKLNERQRKVIERMLQATLGNFEGGMNARKYVSLTQASKATATRDLQELVELGILVSVGKGRSYRYDINMDFE